jgi:hypothetical protein
VNRYTLETLKSLELQRDVLLPLAEILFAAVTDHRFIDTGHTLDFTNKALEALDKIEWENNRVWYLVMPLLKGRKNQAPGVIR